MNRYLAYDLPSSTWLARRDPRLKLLWLGVVSLASVLLDSPPALTALCLVTLAVAVPLGWSPRTWIAVAALLAAVTWGTMLSQAMFYAGEPRTVVVTLIPPFRVASYEFPGLHLIREGAIYGLLQSQRMIAGVLAALTVCLSTSPERLMGGLTGLRVPSAVSFMTVAALRFLPTLLEEWGRVRAACRLRGYRPRLLSPVGARDSWRVEAGLLVPVVASALRRASTLASSITARGFDATQPRSSFPQLRMITIEVAAAAILSVAALALSALKSLYWLSAAGLFHVAALEPLYRVAAEWL